MLEERGKGVGLLLDRSNKALKRLRGVWVSTSSECKIYIDTKLLQ